MSKAHTPGLAKFALLVATAALIAGCGGGGGDSTTGTPQTNNPPPPTGTNSAPTIQGQPAGSVAAGQSYSF
ncbi:MAG TPA: hypothetical protein VKB34_07435, partial [Povalibacter sp.]|nr:hypothetical protein [Povalibacter sp.]